MDEELLKFWQILNLNKVKYIMIGGLAIRFHGYNRTTDDLDIWIEDTLQNRQNLRKAFVDLEYGDFPLIETMQFVPGWTSFYAAGITLDILTEMKGLENYTFDECYHLATVASLENTEIRFLHINHLIENKKTVNRPKDQLDVLALEKIRTLKDSK